MTPTDRMFAAARTTFAPLLVAAVFAGNLLAWLTGWSWPW